MSYAKADPARGARVELAMRFAEAGDLSGTMGMLAGMPHSELAEYGPLVLGALERAAPGTVAELREWLRAATR